MSDNIDNLLGDIYSSSSQSQGVKELANLINNLSQLLLKGISQLEARVLKLEQQMSGGGGGTPRAPRPSAPTPTARATPPAPKPAVASPFTAPTAPRNTPPPPPSPVTTTPTPTPAPVTTAGPSSANEAASMLGVTLKKAPAVAPSSDSSTGGNSGPSFLTSTVNPSAPQPTPTPTSTSEPDAVAPATLSSGGGGGGGGIAGPSGGFRGELAEKLAKRRQAVQQQIEDDFDAPDLSTQDDEEEVEEEVETTSSELKLDLEDELRSAFSKLKG